MNVYLVLVGKCISPQWFHKKIVITNLYSLLQIIVYEVTLTLETYLRNTEE